MHVPHQSEAQAGPSNSGTSRYVVQTSDVIQDMRVNVSEEASGKVIWYKERFLGDDEIVENVVHNPTSTICWTIHRPKRGWYIRIRSPSFPPGVFIPLTPVPQKAPYHTDAAMSFSSRTNIPAMPPPGVEEETQFTLQDEDITSSSASLHSYPPTPTTVVQPPSPTTASGMGDAGPASAAHRPKRSLRSQLKQQAPQTEITTFVLSASSNQTVQQAANASFFARALSVLKSHRPTHSNSFTLSRVISPNPLSPPPPYASSVPLVQETSQVGMAEEQSSPLHTPLLVFHDHTPVLTVRSLTGLIELDKAEERVLGVDTSFWIAMALTYLEFLEERESYLAALSD
ncbi:hypothetical protein B0H34DRAFT_719597 [Crassisporium funariophilum]|nr:hypothetical protein B0H34DRAFT_719597 [Crassisporium funariophilum]